MRIWSGWCVAHGELRLLLFAGGSQPKTPNATTPTVSIIDTNGRAQAVTALRSDHFRRYVYALRLRKCGHMNHIAQDALSVLRVPKMRSDRGPTMRKQTAHPPTASSRANVVRCDGSDSGRSSLKLASLKTHSTIQHQRQPMMMLLRHTARPPIMARCNALTARLSGTA